LIPSIRSEPSNFWTANLREQKSVRAQFQQPADGVAPSPERDGWRTVPRWQMVARRAWELPMHVMIKVDVHLELKSLLRKRNHNRQTYPLVSSTPFPRPTRRLGRWQPAVAALSE
jgi:hypothetical protein